MVYTFPRNLKSIRKSRHMTQADLAKALNITQSCVSAYELGKSYPPLDHVYDIARILGVEIIELVR